MQEVVGDKEDPEFWPESHCPFFSLPTGSGSCYADEIATALQTIANDGAVKIDNITKAIQETFGSQDSPYQIALAKRADKKFPISGPWLNGGVIKSLENIKNGYKPPGPESCEDNDGFALAVPCFLLSLDIDNAKTVANLVTTSHVSMTHFRVQNLILANYINNVEDPINAAKQSISSELPGVAKEMDDVMAAVKEGMSQTDIVNKFGKACELPGSFQGALTGLLLAPDFVTAVRRNILAGGDCCSRATYIGLALGAKWGIEAIPIDWIKRVNNIGNILDIAIKVYGSSK